MASLGCKTNGVHQTVQTVPALAQRGHGLFDLIVFRHITGQHDIRAQFFGKAFNTFFKTLAHIGQGNISTLLATCLRNPVSNRAIREDACDQDAFSLQETHAENPLCN